MEVAPLLLVSAPRIGRRKEPGEPRSVPRLRTTTWGSIAMAFFSKGAGSICDVTHPDTDIRGFDGRMLQRNPRLALQVVQRLAGRPFQYKPNSSEMDHIFPRSKLRKKGYDEAEINHFANFWLLSKGKNQNKGDKPPSIYFEDVPESQMRGAFI